MLAGGSPLWVPPSQAPCASTAASLRQNHVAAETWPVRAVGTHADKRCCIANPRQRTAAAYVVLAGGNGLSAPQAVSNAIMLSSMSVLRNNRFYRITGGLFSARLYASPADRCNRLFSELRHNITHGLRTDKTLRQDYLRIVSFIQRFGHASLHFTTLVNYLFGHFGTFCVCFADNERLLRETNDTRVPALWQADGFTLGLPARKRTWLVLCNERQVLHRINHPFLGLIQPILRPHFQLIRGRLAYPPVPLRHVFHYLILHEVGHVALSDPPLLSLPIRHIDITLEEEVPVDQWASEHLSRMLSMERHIFHAHKAANTRPSNGFRHP